MCNSAISLISKALDTVDNAEVLLKIKGVIALFIQTMDVSTQSLWLDSTNFDKRVGVILCLRLTTSC
jgi:hypothetical protein